MPSFGATNTPDAVPARLPPPVAPRSVSLQTWQSSTAPDGDGSRHARSASMDSLESSGSSSSGGNGHRGTPDTIADYIPTRTVGKTTKLPAHNPLQFVKVQSPLYKKAEQQIKQTKEVKVTRETLKEGEEEWQSNLDNWKSRRRKVSEKVIQRAEEMRQIEAEEQLRQEQYQQQQRKIKKFSEIVEKRSSSRSYNLDFYIGQGDDSGLGGTPEPDDAIDSHSSMLRSDTSEGMTSEAESIDSDIHKSDKIPDKEPPKVPQKPLSRLKKDQSIDEFENTRTSRNNFSHQFSTKNLSAFDNFSSTDPSDIEGHGGDNETISSEEDIPYLSNDTEPVGLMKNLCDSTEENITSGYDDSVQNIIKQEIDNTSQFADIHVNDKNTHCFNICIKSGDNRGFGFTLKGGQDQRCKPYIDSIIKYSAADITGLKEGDEIVSLNGEKVTDSSHASIIFSVKQAVYTGVLDLVVYRSSDKASLLAETQSKSSIRKSSFAEKLALFSSGVNGSTTSTEENKCSISSNQTADDNKPKSLVLRRRSAFENGKSENHVSHRRSTGLSQESQFIKADNLGKRFSVDSSISQVNIQENISTKKGPPPPIPMKPKIRPKTSQDSLTSEIELNGFNKNQENSHSIQSNNITVTCSIAENQKNISHTELFNENEIELGMKCLQLHDKNTENIQSCINSTLLDEIEGPQISGDSACHILSTNSYNSVDHTNFGVSGNETFNIYQSVSERDIITEDDMNNRSDDSSFSNSDLPHSFSIASTKNNELECQNIETACEEISDISKPVSESCITVSFTSTNPLVNDEDEHNFETTDSYSKLNSDVVSIDDLDETDGNEEDIKFPQNNIFSEIEASDETDFTLEASTINELKPSQDETEYNYVDENPDDFEESINSNIAILEESISRIQINPSPLCLPLEKIDEDDVISASTTTSSETPDTETVIETLPLNVSPLPNDESNGEESSKPISENDNILDNPTESPSVSSDIAGADDSNECLETFADVPNQEAHNLTEVKFKNGYAFTEEQDEEYCRELDESLDQITSLDVIDEIEQRLMHQLEQQGDTFEEMNEELTTQLENDINKQWLYFTEETELLDDLTPRNLEPPSEPPPPPPSFEIDSSTEKLVPMTRANSTKRIKKELWRRRSDFLGLDSPEGIDVDNILHPPPGIEEILKQEREQNQWLEKRLSLAENDLSAPLYTSETLNLESQNYNQSDYSEFFEEEDNSPVESPPENWKENLGEQCKFDPACDLQYVPDADVPSPASEDAPKIGDSPQRKAKQNIHNLGAAPKAKIMDSNKWITEKVIPINKKSIEPVFHQNTYNQNYWLAQDDERKKVQSVENTADKRFSMPHFASHHPDVTIRTWGDREYEFQKQRPKSAAWNSTANDDLYNPYSQHHRQDVLRSHSLDSHRECDSDILESEVHNCSCCGKGLCEGSAMGIEALRLYFHIECFRCCICRIQLGNGSCGTDVQVKNNRLFCPSCFTVD